MIEWVLSIRQALGLVPSTEKRYAYLHFTGCRRMHNLGRAEQTS